MKPMTILISALLLTGCVASKIETPAGYQELDDVYGLDYKALSADASAISVDTVDNPKEAKLDFVAETSRNHVLRSLGYTLKSEQLVETTGGLTGREMLFTHQEAGVQRTYLLTVFVTGGMGGKIIRVQAGGESSTFDPDLPKIRKAISTLK